MDDTPRHDDEEPTAPVGEDPAPSLPGSWIPPGGGYSPGAGERPAGGGAPFGEAPTQPQPEASERPRRLRRSSTDRMIGGVAGGLGRYFDIDPVLFRIAFVVLLFAGGAGILAYLGLWLVTPSDETPAEGAGVRALAVVGGVVLVLVALPFLFVGAIFAIPLLPLALLVLAVVLLARGARGKADGGAGAVLARVALALLVVVVSVAAFFAAAAGAAVGGGAVIAGVVVALGLGLAASGLDLKGGMGEREFRPASLSGLRDHYKLGAGELKLDLRDLELPSGRTPLHLKVGAGHAVVYVPENVCVSSTVHVGAGYAKVLDRDSGGFDVDWDNRRTAPAGVPTLALDADVGIGAIEVRHNHEREFGRFGRFARDDGSEAVDACAA